MVSGVRFQVSGNGIRSRAGLCARRELTGAACDELSRVEAGSAEFQILNPMCYAPCQMLTPDTRHLKPGTRCTQPVAINL
jgi:hypothetical protein